MADIGHELTEDILAQLEKEIAEEYRTATREVEKKLRDYLEKTEAQRKVQEKLWKDGVITKKEYTDWCFRHEMVGKRWQEMKEVLAQDYHRANQIALDIAKGKMPDIYATNVNYATYQIEQSGRVDTGFTLYNHDTANYLLGDQRQLMPKPSTKKAAQIAANKDMQWNMRKIQSAVLQGVLQGESAYDVAHRLEKVGQMNYNSAVRYARTMGTSAQNAGRYEAFRRADRLGVDLTIEWQATLDHRTRHDHRLMHGQRKEVDKPFVLPNGQRILYPADCTGDSYKLQGEIWNCRCTLLSWVKGFEGETLTHSDKMGDMTYEEWLNEKAPKTKIEEETFKQRIDTVKMKVSQDGLIEEHIKEAGKALADEYGKAKAGWDKALEEVDATYKVENEKAWRKYCEADDARTKLRKDLIEKEFNNELPNGIRWFDVEEYKTASEESDKLYKIWQDKSREYFTAKSLASPSPTGMADWLSNKLAEVREVGADGLNIGAHLNNSGSRVVPNIKFAYNHYPRSWVEKSINRGAMTPRVAARGYYQDGRFSEIRISGSGNSATETAFHELGHRFEDVVDGITDFEKAFYVRRTQDEELKKLNSIYKGVGYRNNEVTRRDNFLDAYMGKEYSSGKYYELVSMGFQYAYMNPEELARDPDMQEWIYGLLTLVE